MNYSEIKRCDIANGSGVRTTVFVSGCERGCPGCFNPSAWPFDAGKPMTDEVMRKVYDSILDPYIDGLSIVGGEPLHPRNLDGVRELMLGFRRRFGTTKTIWVWTGYRFEELDDEQLAVICLADVLVDGPFIEAKKDLTLRFRGSSNQRIIDINNTSISGAITLWDDGPILSSHRWQDD